MRRLGVCMLPLLIGCSTFTTQQEDAFKVSYGLASAFNTDYAAIDCQGCESCEIMQRANGQATTATMLLAFEEDPDEKHFKRYRNALMPEGEDDIELATTLVTCGDCEADAALCPPAVATLNFELQNAKSTQAYLDTDTWGSATSSFFRSIFRGLFGWLRGD